MHYRSGSYDSSLFFWNKLFEVYEAKNQWDSIYDCAEKYIISHSRIFRIEEANRFLDKLQRHIVSEHPVDSIELTKVWVRRSEMLYADAKLTEAVDTLEAVLALRQRNLRYPHPLIADAYDYLQITTGSRGSFWESAKYGERGIKAFKDCINIGYVRESSNLPWVIGNTGETYNQLGDYDKAIGFLQEAYDSLKRPGNPVDSWMYYKMLLGGSYQRKGDYRKAIAIYQECVDTFRNTDNRSYLAESYGRLALCYKEIGLDEEMMSFATKHYKLYEEIHGDRGHIEQMNACITVAECLMAAEQPEKASTYISKALSIVPYNPDSVSLTYLDVLFRKGKLFQSLRHYDSAMYIFDFVEEKRKQLLGQENDLVGLVIMERARLESDMTDYHAAIAHGREAISILQKSRSPLHPLVKECYYILVKATFEGLGKRPEAVRIIDTLLHGEIEKHDFLFSINKSSLNLIGLKAEMLRVPASSRDTSALLASLAAYQQLSDAYQIFLNHTLYQGSNFLTGTSYVKTIKDGFMPAARMYLLTGDRNYLQQALDFSEQSRTGSIRLALQNYQASRFANVPDSVISAEEQLRIDCAQYEKLLMGAASRGIPASEIDRWSDSLMNKRRSSSKLLDHISLVYPKYYQLKLSRRTATVAEVQSIASSTNSTIIEYVFTSDRVFAFAFNGSEVLLKELGSSKDSIWTSVRRYRQALEEGDPSAYGVVGYELFQVLLRPIVERLNPEKICVVADEALHYISFESLLQKPAPITNPQWKELPYAVYHHKFRYAHSVTVMLQQYTVDRRTDKSHPWLAMAPGFDREVTSGMPDGTFKDSMYQSLLRQPWAMQLATELKKMVYAVSFTGRKATEYRYNQEAKSASVVYIGTHAFPDDADPMQSQLVFTRGTKLKPENNGYLHAYEIYRTPLTANLVVLGGCETGHGQMRSGEGIISLATGFAYAGCPSMVMTLWQIDDKQSAGLLKSFFNFTKEHRVSDALSRAKQKYLQESHPDELYNPLYWSGLVSIGSDDFIPSMPPRDASKEIVSVTLTVVGLILGIYWYLRKRRTLSPFSQ